MTIVRAAITQTTWTGDKESMIDKHEQFARDAAAQGARSSASRSCSTARTSASPRTPKYYDYAEPCRRADVQRFAALAKELGMVMVLPIYEEEQPGVYYNTAVVDRRRRHATSASTASTTSRTSTEFWEKFYFRPGNLGYPVFDTAVGKIGVYICYDRHFPEGWRELGLNGAQIVFNPNATKPGLSNRLWEIEQPAAAVANGYFVAAPTTASAARTTSTATHAVDFYGSSATSSTRAATTSARSRLRTTEEIVDPRPRPGHGPRRCATTGSSTATAGPESYTRDRERRDAARSDA